MTPIPSQMSTPTPAFTSPPPLPLPSPPSPPALPPQVPSPVQVTPQAIDPSLTQQVPEQTAQPQVPKPQFDPSALSQDLLMKFYKNIPEETITKAINRQPPAIGALLNGGRDVLNSYMAQNSSAPTNGFEDPFDDMRFLSTPSTPEPSQSSNVGSTAGRTKKMALTLNRLKGNIRSSDPYSTTSYRKLDEREGPPF